MRQQQILEVFFHAHKKQETEMRIIVKNWAFMRRRALTTWASSFLFKKKSTWNENKFEKKSKKMNKKSHTNIFQHFVSLFHHIRK